MEQLDILRHAVEALERMKVPYIVVGSIASIAYGESRFTQDIDIIAAFEMKHVDELIASFPADEFYLSESAVRDAIRTSFQFNVIHPGSGNKIDFILPRDDQWGGTQMGRGRPVRLFPDRDLMIAAPEDVILGRLLGGHRCRFTIGPSRSGDFHHFRQRWISALTVALNGGGHPEPGHSPGDR